jgi:hypothetical protein
MSNYVTQLKEFLDSQNISRASRSSIVAQTRGQYRDLSLSSLLRWLNSGNQADLDHMIYCDQIIQELETI